MSHGPKITAKILERDCFETNPPLFGFYVAEEESENQTKDTVLVGYALYYYAYSTWSGKRLFLEDLYVSEKVRGQGLGTKLLKQIAKHTIENQCVDMEFNVLSWNPARAFYESMGAINVSETEKVDLFRLSGVALKLYPIP